MKLKMSLKNLLLIFVIAFFSVIILWNLACALGYVREGMEDKNTEEDTDEQETEEDDKEDETENDEEDEEESKEDETEEDETEDETNDKK